jgi:GrpB-like predicted nucleotidyltransferase (UPF0157 family)
VIVLYELVATPRGLRPEELPVEERLELGWRALSAIEPTFELGANSGREPEPIELVPYDPAWALRFEEWRERLLAALPKAPRSLDHIGSTAVPGLAAKPVIDIQVGVEDLEDEASYAPAIESLGVQLRSRDREHRYFRPFAGMPREVHIHVCRAGTEWERRHLVFRDYLRANFEARRRYLEAKEAAAARWNDDRTAYTHAKGRVIRELEVEAQAFGRRAAG